jgi:hypothetical protein
MADGFDAYFKWLGIPPAEQPPSHYRLLGVPELVDDPDVIESAADQRMSHLRGLQTGKNAAHAQRLLNEVSQARVCLLNAEQKRAYDQRLRSSKPDVPKGKPPAAVPMSAESPLAAPAARPAPLQINTQGNQRGRAIWMHPAVLGLAMAGVVGLMLVVVVLWMRGGSGNEVAQNAPPGNDTPTAPNDDASPMESPAAKEANEAESQENGNPSGVAARGNPIDTPPADPAPAANENSPPAPPADSPSVDQAPADPAPAEPPPSPDPSPADPMPVTPAVGETRPSAPAESTADARLAIPSDEQQVKAFASINEVFDFAAAEAPPQQLKIAGELLAFGKKSQNNPAEKFVLLREAMRLAKAGGDARLMLQAIDEIGGDFEIDAPAVRQKMLIGFADEARQAESIRRPGPRRAAVRSRRGGGRGRVCRGATRPRQQVPQGGLRSPQADRSVVRKLAGDSVRPGGGQDKPRRRRGESEAGALVLFRAARLASRLAIPGEGERRATAVARQTRARFARR